MSCPLTGSEANLAAYWNFDAGAVLDLTGNAHNGTLAGTASVIPIPGSDDVHARCVTVKFTEVTLTSGRLPRISVSGQTNVNIQINASTNLLDWFSLIILPNPEGTVQFTDALATNFPTRFYRAVVP